MEPQGAKLKMHLIDSLSLWNDFVRVGRTEAKFRFKFPPDVREKRLRLDDRLQITDYLFRIYNLCSFKWVKMLLTALSLIIETSKYFPLNIIPAHVADGFSEESANLV